MNFRSRQFLDLCYEFDCLLQIPGVCEGGVGEPCHANWSWAGKGGAMKAHDAFAVPGCRACHMAIDQGSLMPGEVREGYWLRAFGRYLPELLARGLIAVTVESRRESAPNSPAVARRKGGKRGTHTAKPDKCRIGWTRESAEGSN